VHLGSLVHIAAAVAGLSALIVSSAIAFSAVKYVGAAYLVLRRDPQAARQGRAGRGGGARAPAAAVAVFSQGVVVNVLNPKTALFFLAFLPQFVDPDRPVWTQTIVLGLCWIGLGLLSDGAYALLGGTIGRRPAPTSQGGPVRLRRDLRRPGRGRRHQLRPSSGAVNGSKSPLLGTRWP
jgi:threonine/homoserine/homoserine lactone efflux protein